MAFKFWSLQDKREGRRKEIERLKLKPFLWCWIAMGMRKTCSVVFVCALAAATSCDVSHSSPSYFFMPSRSKHSWMSFHFTPFPFSSFPSPDNPIKIENFFLPFSHFFLQTPSSETKNRKQKKLFIIESFFSLKRLKESRQICMGKSKSIQLDRKKLYWDIKIKSYRTIFREEDLSGALARGRK